MVDESKKAYEIILHNFRALSGTKTVDVVRGAASAERAVEFLNKKLTPQQSLEGWSHFLKETNKKPRGRQRRSANLKPDSFRKR